MSVWRLFRDYRVSFVGDVLRTSWAGAGLFNDCVVCMFVDYELAELHMHDASSPTRSLALVVCFCSVSVIFCFFLSNTLL
mgnify:CR=1 FL=1